MRGPDPQTPSAVADFLSKCSDDAGCAWLCLTAGRRTPAQEQGMGIAMRTIAPFANAAPPPPIPLSRIH